MNEPNAAQVAYWNDAAGPTWVEVQEQMDRQLAPLGRRAMKALVPMPGERMVDIGCGSGQTSLELARAVQPDGSILGIDLSAPLLAVARRRAAGLGEVEFVQADAQVFDFAPGSFDAAFSRFGVMFFDDPVAAFQNVRRALKPGGRLAFACWRALEENPAFNLPMKAAAPHLPELLATSDPLAPGPFAFANPERVHSILVDSGFREIAVAPHDETVEAGDLKTALALSLKMGLLGSSLREQPSMREVVAPPVQAALAEHNGPNGVMLNAAIWIVTAISPA